MTPASGEPPRLIVNADDYGRFACVSRGILRSAAQGIVTATGVFANLADFGEHAAWLRDCDALDCGVHLNLTEGAPLTRDCERSLRRWSGRFPPKFAMARALLAGALEVDVVKAEWRAQVERCLEHGLEPRFLNSHEHMHMLPALFPVAAALAREYGIRHVRFPTTRLAWSSLARSGIIKLLARLNRRHMDAATTHFLGLEKSGRLDLPYLRATLARLRPGRVYELMCHPGQCDPREAADPRLSRYHDWQGELRTLTSPEARELLARRGVRLVGYRHLEPEPGESVPAGRRGPGGTAQPRARTGALEP